MANGRFVPALSVRGSAAFTPLHRANVGARSSRDAAMGPWTSSPLRTSAQPAVRPGVTDEMVTKQRIAARHPFSPEQQLKPRKTPKTRKGTALLQAQGSPARRGFSLPEKLTFDLCFHAVRVFRASSQLRFPSAALPTDHGLNRWKPTLHPTDQRRVSETRKVDCEPCLSASGHSSSVPVFLPKSLVPAICRRAWGRGLFRPALWRRVPSRGRRPVFRRGLFRR